MKKIIKNLKDGYLHRFAVGVVQMLLICFVCAFNPALSARRPRFIGYPGDK
jgi:hypothetical protein